MKVDRYVEPEEFAKWKNVAEGMGFLYVASGPLVRSSYKVSSFKEETVGHNDRTDVLVRLVNSLLKMYSRSDVQLLPSTLLPNYLHSRQRSLPRCNCVNFFLLMHIYMINYL